MSQQPFYATIEQLHNDTAAQIPSELQSNAHLIYSSPATLAFNSPGATGFGVKRAGLAVPGSIMLLVAPGCCGRNTKLLAEVPGYEDRFFFLLMNESDIVNGRHLEKIPQAIEEILEDFEEKPSVVMICSTCVDALLGTDWERVCRKAEEHVGLPVRPCYMYALTREGRKPPMVLVRKTIYSLLEPAEKDARTVNLLGYFSPLVDDCELYDLLKGIGVRTINEISRCPDFASYMELSKANFNLVLDAEARLAAEDLQSRLQIPYLELTRLYQVDKIHNQYKALGQAIGAELADESYYEETLSLVTACRERFGKLRICVGEMMNGNAFELALALLKYGFVVPEIYANVTKEDYVYIRHLVQLSPETKVFTNLSPTMLYYDCSETEADLTIGMDAAYYHPDCPHVLWNEERQPFGYAGVRRLIGQITAALEESEQ